MLRKCAKKANKLFHFGSRTKALSGWSCQTLWSCENVGKILTETNSEFAPENGWLEYGLFPFRKAHFEGRAVSFREGRWWFKSFCFFTLIWGDDPIRRHMFFQMG